MNPELFEQASSAMSTSEMNEYDEIGKYMYETCNYSTDPNVQQTQLALASLNEHMKAGLLPQSLKKEEKELLERFYGAEWYKRYGYETSEDM